MSRSMKWCGWLAASMMLGLSAGCVESTEIPLAKVAPVTSVPSANKQQPRAGAIVSPAHVEGHN